MSQELTSVFKNEQFVANIAQRCISQEDAGKFVKMFETAMHKTPNLMRCSKESIISAAYNLAELDLSPIAAHGQAYLIPYGDTCQLQISWRGLITIAMRDGGVKSITAQVVYEDDFFDFELGLEPILKHKVSISGSRADNNIVAVYAIAVLQDGSKLFEVMSKFDIDQIRLKHHKKPKFGNSPWDTSYSEMARKTVVKRLCKYLPISTKALDAIEIDNKFEEKEIISDTSLSMANRLKNEIIPDYQPPIEETPGEVLVTEEEKVQDVLGEEFEIIRKHFSECSSMAALKAEYMKQREILKEKNSYDQENGNKLTFLFHNRTKEIEASK